MAIKVVRASVVLIFPCIDERVIDEAGVRARAKWTELEIVTNIVIVILCEVTLCSIFIPHDPVVAEVFHEVSTGNRVVTILDLAS